MPRAAGHGDGEVRLLLVHGFFSARSAWDGVRSELGPGTVTLAPDVLGYGAARCGGEYTLARVVEHLVPLVERERPTHVVGHSMGGIVALALAARLPGAFERAGVIGLPVYATRAEAIAYLVRRRRNHLFLRAGNVAHAGCELLHRSRALWAPLAARRRGGAVVVDAFNHCRASHSGGLNQIVFAGHTEALAAAVTTPVAAIHGGRDRAAPLAPARELAQRHGWDFTVVPGHGHQAIVERPSQVAAWIREKVIG